MHIKVFSKVYCDRVYFLCAERFVTGLGFEPPAAPPYPLESRVPLPPPPPHPGAGAAFQGWRGSSEAFCPP